MTTTLTVTFDGKVLIPSDPVDLPKGTPVRLQVVLPGDQLETNLLNVHVAEYNALTSRCTSWLSYVIPIWTALIISIPLVSSLWPQADHVLVLLAGGAVAQILFLVWFQTIEEQYIAVSYIEERLRPLVQRLVGSDEFWAYESQAAGRDDRLNWWGEWLLPAGTTVGVLGGFYYLWVNSGALRWPKGSDWAFLGLVVTNVGLLLFQWAKTVTRVRLRRRVAAAKAKRIMRVSI